MNLVEQTVNYLDRTNSKVTIKEDGYGGFSKTIATTFYEYQDWDDGSFIINQYNHGTIDKTLRFGPLTAKLSELLARGFYLTIESFAYRRKHNLILRNINDRRESYKVAVIANEDLYRHKDLTMFIRDQSEPDYHPPGPPKPLVKIVEKEVIKEVMIEVDPFDKLLMRYPLKRKPVEFIGNLTLDEYVKQQLKENRKLHYVE